MNSLLELFLLLFVIILFFIIQGIICYWCWLLHWSIAIFVLCGWLIIDIIALIKSSEKW